MLVENMPDWAGTIPGWLTALSSTGAFGLILKWWIDNRKMNIEERTQRDNADAAQIARYAEEVNGLRKELSELTSRYQASLAAQGDRYQSLLEASDRRHAECEEAREKLIKQVHALRDELTGVIRMVLANSVGKARLLGEVEGVVISPELEQAMKKVEEVFATNGFHPKKDEEK